MSVSENDPDIEAADRFMTDPRALRASAALFAILAPAPNRPSPGGSSHPGKAAPNFPFMGNA